VILVPGNGNGTFRTPVQLATGASPFAMAVGQFDGHNLPEVAVLGTSTISVLLNDSGGAGLVGASPLAAIAAAASGTHGSLTNTVSAILDTSPTTASGNRIDDQTRTLPPSLDNAAIDQVFAAVAKADQQLWLAYHSLRMHKTMANANGDDFSG
jgi:hypothetical protein